MEQNCRWVSIIPAKQLKICGNGTVCFSLHACNTIKISEVIILACCLLADCAPGSVTTHGGICDYNTYDLMPCLACRPSHPLITRVTDWSEVEEALALKLAAHQH